MNDESYDLRCGLESGHDAHAHESMCSQANRAKTSAREPLKLDYCADSEQTDRTNPKPHFQFQAFTFFFSSCMRTEQNTPSNSSRPTHMQQQRPASSDLTPKICAMRQTDQWRQKNHIKYTAQLNYEIASQA